MLIAGAKVTLPNNLNIVVCAPVERDCVDSSLATFGFNFSTLVHRSNFFLKAWFVSEFCLWGVLTFAF